MMAEDVRSDEPIALSVAFAPPNTVPATEAVHDTAAFVQNVPKKRSRKSKIANPTKESSQMGRSPLSRDSLMISP